MLWQPARTGEIIRQIEHHRGQRGALEAFSELMVADPPSEAKQVLLAFVPLFQHKSYPPDELAVRFKHRIVTVHPFPNGNGRWSRLAGDLLIVQQGGTRFTWGGANIQASGEIRKRYMDALHAADNHDLEPLIRFARS